jgi:hypothetical protein
MCTLVAKAITGLVAKAATAAGLVAEKWRAGF